MTAATLATGCSSSDGSVESFCDQVTRVPIITDRDQLSMPDPTSAAATLVLELRRLRAASPEDIRGDVGVLVEVSEHLEAALTATDETARRAATAQVDERRGAWKDASANVVGYAKSNCDVDLGRP